jgi:hypothetical protein
MRKTIRYIDKHKLPNRPPYGSPEYRQYLDRLGEVIFEGVVVALQTELQRGALEFDEDNNLVDMG